MIELENVSKEYKLNTAIDDMSLQILEDGIYCLLGRNGAGKTTLMKLIAGHINAGAGSITVDRQKVSTAHIPKQINYIESQSEHFNLKLEDMIYTAASLQSDFDTDFAFEMTDRFKLSRKKRFKQLSFGMKTMITTLIGLASNSKIILLDEPVLGFDAIMRVQFYEMLQQSYLNNPRIIIVSTHILDEIAKTAQKLLIIDHGKLLFSTDIDEFDEKSYSITGMNADIQPLLANLNVIGKVSDGGFTTAYIFDKRINIPSSITIQPMGLQDFFINLVGGIDHE